VDSLVFQVWGCGELKGVVLLIGCRSTKEEEDTDCDTIEMCDDGKERNLMV
jgi:hypothetical protein